VSRPQSKKASHFCETSCEPGGKSQRFTHLDKHLLIFYSALNFSILHVVFNLPKSELHMAG
jgi:hypothetical protein